MGVSACRKLIDPKRVVSVEISAFAESGSSGAAGTVLKGGIGAWYFLKYEVRNTYYNELSTTFDRCLTSILVPSVYVHTILRTKYGVVRSCLRNSM